MAAVVSCSLGMASKEAMATVPVMVLLYDRAYAAGSIAEALRRRRRFYTALAATWLLLAALMLTFPHRQTRGFGAGIGAWDYAKNQCIVVLEYLRLVVWPHPLVLDYGVAQPVPLRAALPGAIVLGLLVLATGIVHVYRPLVGFLPVWTLVSLAPTSSIVPIVSEVGAERRMYLPLAGIVVLAVLAGHAVLGRVAARVRWIMLAAVAASLIAKTVHRNEQYRSALALWQTAVAARPENPRARVNLAGTLQQRGRAEAAVAELRRALDLAPEHRDAHNNLAVALMAQGEVAAAIRHYRRAIEIDPSFFQAHSNLGNALVAHGRSDEALPHYREAVRLRPREFVGHYNLGRVLLAEGRIEEAIRSYRHAMEIRPDSALGHNGLGAALAANGEHAAALRHYREAVRLDPGMAEAHANLAGQLLAAGRIDEAVAHCRRALAADPELLAAQRILAVAEQLRATTPQAQGE
jgi:tetratricopeptide (TPR) repeat protein